MPTFSPPALSQKPIRNFAGFQLLGHVEPKAWLTGSGIPPYTPVCGTHRTMETSFMSRAIQLSIDNVRSGKGGPFGALIAKGGSVVAEGVNRVTQTNDPTAHAEINAIRAACAALKSFELRGCELYTSCEPCPMCLGAIYWARLDRVYYAGLASDAAAAGFDDSFIYREIAQPHPNRAIPMVQMMREDALAAFQTWQQSASKIPY